MQENPITAADNCLYAEKIDKIYPGTKALDQVSYQLKRGKVNVLIGENGAGKSTLMKIIAGIEKPSSGKLYMDGKEVSFNGTRDAREKGIAIIHQELSLYPNMNVFENMFVGAEITTKAHLLDNKKHYEKAAEVLKRLEHPIDPAVNVGELSVGQKQIVEIARNLIDPHLRVLIMDEPTSSLSSQEVEVLFRIIRDLKKQGISIVYISHRLEEIMEIGDCITVLRDGRVVAEAEVKDVSVQWIVEKMVGTAGRYEIEPRDIDWKERKEKLRVQNLCLPKKGGGYLLDHISFTVKEGEILGIYGLLGAGRTELFECMMGLRPEFTGEIYLDGKKLEIRDIAGQIRNGFAMVPEDRQKEGIVQTLNIRKNIVLSSLSSFCRKGVLRKEKEKEGAKEMIRDLHIKVADDTLPILSLSGGNQQKTVIAKGILTGPDVLLLDEPSRGIDVGAKAEVFDIIRQYAERGLTILVISSELKEVLSVTDRVLVMSNGKVTGEFEKAEMSEQAFVEASYKGHARSAGKRQEAENG